jgi:nucleotide-binding universal stress UspA family protein
VQRILAAVDPAPRDVEHDQINDTIVELAISLAQQFRGHFDVLHVWSFYGEHLLVNRMREEELHQLRNAAQSQISRAYEQLLSDYGLTLASENVHLVEGERSRAIVDFVNRHAFDLLVIGTVACSGSLGLLMGNTAEEVLNRIPCSVLAVKPEGFVSSVAPPAE